MIIFYVIYMLIFMIAALILYSLMQLKSLGIKVKDFWTFIEANQMLDKLYAFSKRYQKLSTQEQLIYLSEAEKVFKAFENVPEILWEDDYEKYMEVLNRYREIRMIRWASN